MKSQYFGFYMSGCACTLHFLASCGRILVSCSDACLETVVDKGPKAATESKKQSQYLTDVRKYQTTGEVRDRQSRKFNDTEAAESQRITAWCKYCMICLSSRIKITSEATFDRSNRIVTG